MRQTIRTQLKKTGINKAQFLSQDKTNDMRMILIDLFKCYTPFIILLLAFSSLKYIVPYYDAPIHYSFMPAMDRTITGGMPTAMLQKLLWHGHVVWYDYFFYAFYAAHYVLIVFLAWMVYKFRKDGFEYFYSVYLLATLSAFVFFVLYPTAPPWMASSDGYIPHITRVSQAVFNSLGVHNFAGLYNRYSPDAAGAFPSLHSAYASLFSIFTFRFFGKRWGTLSLIYPLTIFFAVIYLGEHYLTDVIAGVALSFSCYWAVPYLLKKGRLVYEQVLVRLKLIMNERKW